MARHLFAILDDLTDEPGRAEGRVCRRLRSSAARSLAEARTPASAPRRAKGAAPRAKRRIGPKRRAAMKQQGLYLGGLRRLKPAQRAQVKKARATKGLPAALALARKLAR